MKGIILCLIHLNHASTGMKPLPVLSKLSSKIILTFWNIYPNIRSAKIAIELTYSLFKKLTDERISKNIAQIFKTLNLLEIKGIGYSSLDVSLTLLSCHYPRKLINHLKQERKLPVAKISNGVYYINKETFHIQIIVTKELSAEDNLYLHCLTDNLQDTTLANQLADDCKLHLEQEIYIKYLHQISTANFKKMKGDTTMVCEGLLNLCGTTIPLYHQGFPCR